MASQAPLPYELLLLGVIDRTDVLQAVLRRLAAHSAAGSRDFVLEEVVTLRVNGSATNEDDKLRLRRLRCDDSPASLQWSMVSLQRLLSARDYPNVAVRGLSIVPIVPNVAAEDAYANALKLAQSLGYRGHSSLRKTGQCFYINGVWVFVYQLFAPTTSEKPVQPANVWVVEVQHLVLFIPPAPIPATRLGQPAPPPPPPTKLLTEVLSEGIARVEEVSALLRGLVTLQRVEQ